MTPGSQRKTEALTPGAKDEFSTANTQQQNCNGNLAQTVGLTDVRQEIVSNVRRFVDKEIIPVASQLEDRHLSDGIVEQMAEMGLFGLMIPENAAGSVSRCSPTPCASKNSRGWMSVSGVINTHFIVAYHMIRQHGTDEQKQNYLPRMATGELRGAFSMSEPELGSDVAAIRTKARPDADGNYRIDGPEDGNHQQWQFVAGGGPWSAPTTT